MWIKTKDGTYLNTDKMVYILYDWEADTTDCRMCGDGVYELCDGDHVKDIIRNIISGTPVLEVQ